MSSFEELAAACLNYPEQEVFASIQPRTVLISQQISAVHPAVHPLRYQLTTGQPSSIPYFSFKSFLISWSSGADWQASSRPPDIHRVEIWLIRVFKPMITRSLTLPSSISTPKNIARMQKTKVSSVVAGVIRSTIEFGNLRNVEQLCTNTKIEVNINQQ